MQASCRHCGATPGIERDRVGTRFEVAGIAKEIPAVLKLTCSAEIPTINRGPRETALDQDAGTHDPAFKELARRFPAGNAIEGVRLK